MDAGMADRLAASMDPKALSALQNRGGDPAVARAVAGQFGSFLMQGMMQDADGNAMSVAGGTGGAAVSSMFASAMGRFAMSGDKLGLADTIYRSMAAKNGPSPQANDAAAGSAPAATPKPPSGAAPSAQSTGLSLGPYRQEGGHRPFGPPIGHFTPPAQLQGAAKTALKHGVSIHHNTDAAANSRKVPAVAVAAAGTAAAVATPAPQPIPSRRWEDLNLPTRVQLWQPSPPLEAAAAAPAHPAATSAVPVTATTTVPTPQLRPEPTTGNAVPTKPQSGAADAVPPHRHDASGGAHRGAASTQAEDFAEELTPAIQQAAARLGVSPRVLLAQAALETGWGHSVVGNNIFGIKAGASWSGGTVTANTHEMEGGRLLARHGTFRSYATVGDAVDDYVALVSASDRYRQAVGSGDNVAAYAQALAAGGYASDRDYAEKLAAVANGPTMSYAVAATEEAATGQRVLAHG